MKGVLGTCAVIAIQLLFHTGCQQPTAPLVSYSVSIVRSAIPIIGRPISLEAKLSPGFSGATYEWKFGDSSLHDHSPKINYRFRKTGPNILLLTALDSSNRVLASVQDTIMVSSIELHISPDSLLGEQFSTYSFRVTNPPYSVYPSIRFVWSLGDSIVATGANLDSVVNRFMFPGKYFIKVSLFDSSNGAFLGQASCQVFIGPPNIKQILAQCSIAFVSFTGEFHYYHSGWSGVYPTLDSGVEIKIKWSGNSCQGQLAEDTNSTNNTSHFHSFGGVVSNGNILDSMASAATSESYTRDPQWQTVRTVLNIMDIGAVNLPLLDISPKSVTYGVRGAALKEHISTYIESDLWDTNAQKRFDTGTFRYDSTNWNSTTIPSSLVVTFSR